MATATTENRDEDDRDLFERLAANLAAAIASPRPSKFPVRVRLDDGEPVRGWLHIDVDDFGPPRWSIMVDERFDRRDPPRLGQVEVQFGTSLDSMTFTGSALVKSVDFPSALDSRGRWEAKLLGSGAPTRRVEETPSAGTGV